MDADCGAGLVDLSAQPFGPTAGRGSIPVGAPHLFIYDHRWSSGGPYRAPEDSVDVAVVTDGERGDTDCAGCRRRSPRVGDSMPVVCIRVRAGVWWAGVLGADSDTGRTRGHAECDCTEFDSVQPGGDGGSSAGGDRAGEAGREVVLWAERAFVSGADYFAFDHLDAIRAGKYEAINAEKPKTRYTGGYMAAVTLMMEKFLPDRAYDAIVLSQMKPAK